MYFIDISSKLRPNFDTGGIEVWSKVGRSLVEVSTLGVSKFGRSFDQTSTSVSNVCTYKLPNSDMIDPDCGRELWIHIRINRFILIYLYVYIYIYMYIRSCMCIYIYIYIHIYIYRYIWIHLDIHYPQYVV